MTLTIEHLGDGLVGVLGLVFVIFVRGVLQAGDGLLDVRLSRLQLDSLVLGEAVGEVSYQTKDQLQHFLFVSVNSCGFLD